jgi:LMBR1 domain-containing protein 1
VEIRKKSTYPQGLLIGSFLLSIMILAFMLEIQTLAPQYSTFGTQTFKNSFNHQFIPCSLSLTSSLNLKDNTCIISNIAQLYNRISVSFPLFSTIFYMSNWLLILVLFMSLIYAAMCKTENVMDDIESEDQDEKIGLKDCEDNI